MKQEASRVLSQLAHNRSNQVTIAEEGGIMPLISLLVSNNKICKSNATSALAYLSYNTKNQESIINEGSLPRLIRLLASDNKVTFNYLNYFKLF